MRVGRSLLLSLGAVVLVLTVWLPASGGSALHDQAAPLSSPIPTASDIYIQDWRGDMASDEMHADVAYNPDADEYLVVFDWDFSGTGDHDVMYVIVQPDGIVSAMPRPIADDASWDDCYPAVAYNADNDNYLVVWQRREANLNTPYQIFGSLLTSSAGPAFAIMVGSADHLRPDVAYNAGVSRFLVVWEDYGAGWNPPPDIQGKSLDGLGGSGQYIDITSGGAVPNGAQERPAVAAMGASQRWMVTWRDSRHAATTGFDIYGQQVEFDTGFLDRFGGLVPISTVAGEAGAPDVAWGPVGALSSEVLVVWVESNWVYGQRITDNNTLDGSRITVSSFASNKSEPAVAFASGSNSWWTVWQDDRDYG